MKIKHTLLLGGIGLALLPLGAALLWHTTTATGQGIEPPAQALLREQVLLVAAGVSAALLLGWGTLIALFVRRVLRPIGRLRSTVDALADGQSDARSRLSGPDEIGKLGRALDRLLDERIAALERAEQQNEQLNGAVISLLQTVLQLSNRDLTVRADTSQDVTGTLSSAINQLSDVTGSTLAQVREIAEQVNEAAAGLRQQAEQAGSTAQQEGQALQQMSETLTHATRQLMKVARLSESSGLTAARVAHAADSALLATAAAVRGTDELREAMAETEKRFKRLGERNQAIAAAVGLIGTLAERTHILAMNASIQAAGAGEAGRRFGVVAEEVQRLSESSREASSEIAQWLQNLQVETQESLYTINRLIGQVTTQSEQARQAGDQMTLARQNTTPLIEALRKIAIAADQQSLAARELQLSVARLRKGSDQTVAALDQQARSSLSLTQCSQRLRDTVAPFRLPEA